MTTLTASVARIQLYKLLDQTAHSHEPVQIVGKRSSAVLVSHEDWEEIQETLYLQSILGMVKSVKEGIRTPVSQCVKYDGSLADCIDKKGSKRR